MFSRFRGKRRQKHSVYPLYFICSYYYHMIKILNKLNKGFEGARIQGAKWIEKSSNIDGHLRGDQKMKRITDNPEYFETEVKFLITDAGSLREKLISLGAVSGGNFFETNIRFDNKKKTLFKNKSLLRLRKDAKTTLTFKSRPPVKDNQFKIMRELEVEVGDFSIACQLLESLGFIREQIYEKWRETLTIGSTCFCIDKMPYGDFLEIEGQKEEIIKYSSLLGFDWEKRILFNYLKLFDILKTSLSLPFSDVTFENFKNIRIDFSRYFNKVKAEGT